MDVMSRPEELRTSQSEYKNGYRQAPRVNWRDLPIATHKGEKPHFDLKEILLHERETSRLNCQLEAIQQLLGDEWGFRIPKDLAGVFRQLQKWQLVVPTHLDVAQLLFLGRREEDMGAISIENAQATIYIHRGAEGRRKLDGGRYVITWLQVAGVMPDSNGDQRIVGINYNRWGPNPEEAIAIGVNVSFAETEYHPPPTPLNAFIQPTVDILDHRFGIYLTCALMTKGMVELLPSPHERAINFKTNPKGGLYLHQIGDNSIRIDFDHFDQRVLLKRTETALEVGLTERLDGKSPWTVTIPRILETVNTNNQPPGSTG